MFEPIKRYCAGILTEDKEGRREEFYWDTQFASYEECEQWGMEHGLTHIYDDIEDRFYKIGERDE
nr:MAG TPA: hypothetical protein [Caudoviricetes sp.]